MNESVRRWRWRNVAEKNASMPDIGANWGPIAKLLESKRCDCEWNPMLRGYLKSALANRQFTQNRCHKAGWTSHGKCIFCLWMAITGQKMEAVMPDHQSKVSATGTGESGSCNGDTGSRSATEVAELIDNPPQSSLILCPPAR